ncbi:hypothetical protein ABPG74_006667 [Tetrahymena malaccensis]
MTLLKLLIASLLVSQIFCAGADVTCTATTCTTPGTCTTPPSVPSGLSWVNGSANGKCAINTCPVSGTSSGITGASDLFCQSCPGTPNGSVQAVFANTAQNGCVASSLSCGNSRAPNSWTNTDCLACNGSSNQYAKADKTGCQSTAPPTPGADVTCSATTCTTPGTCTAPPSVPSGLSWVNGAGSGKCAINGCPVSGTSSGITGASDLFCQSCPGTPNGSVQAVFANTAQNGCVASSLSCGNSRAPNSWTNTDCLACNGSSNQYAKADKTGCQSTAPLTPGADVTCSATTCTTPGTCTTPPSVPSGLSWVNGSATGKCAINGCPAAGTSSGITGASDLFCQSCPGTPNGSVQAVFANTAQNGCVASSLSCGNSRAPNSWTNTDCLACNGSSNQYAKADKTGCQSTAPPTPGADVTCSATTCTTPGTCTAPPSVPSGLSWVNGAGSGKCAINNCPAAGTSSGITGASDLFCQSCPGTPNGSVQAVFANTAQNGCVASSLACGNTRAPNSWTNADCLACQGSSNQYAKADKSGCQATPPPGADVTCSATTCTTSGTCPAPPTVPSGLSWTNGAASGKCAINTCPTAGTSSGLTGASDLFCQSCPGTPNGQIQAIFANSSGSGCVASNATCGSNRTANSWTNADCLACNGSTNQYAKLDKSGCQSTAPSSSTNSTIVLSSILFLISLLF